MHVTKRIDLGLLADELDAASVPHNGLGLDGTDTDGELYTYTTDVPAAPAELPAAAVPVVDAHVAPPLLIQYAGAREVHALTRTTDALDHEVFRFPCEQHRRYTANLTISGIDAGNFVSRDQEGRFVWKRVTGNAVMVGITMVSNLGEAASSSWAPNALPQGTDIVFTVRGAAGRTIDWLLVGQVSVYSPAGEL